MYLSVLRRGKLYLSKVGPEAFIEALQEFKIAQVVERQTGNKKQILALKLTYKAEDRDTIRMFKLMYDLSKKEGISFDPLELFSGGNVAGVSLLDSDE